MICEHNLLMLYFNLSKARLSDGLGLPWAQPTGPKGRHYPYAPQSFSEPENYNLLGLLRSNFPKTNRKLAQVRIARSRLFAQPTDQEDLKGRVNKERKMNAELCPFLYFILTKKLAETKVMEQAFLFWALWVIVCPLDTRQNSVIPPKRDEPCTPNTATYLRRDTCLFVILSFGSYLWPVKSRDTNRSTEWQEKNGLTVPP